MITTPFNLFKLFNLNNTFYKEHQNFARRLDENIRESLIKDKSNENCTCKSLKQINGDEIRTSVLNWFSIMSQEDKIKICTIHSKWLIEEFYKMNILFQANQCILFEPNEEMLNFFKNNREDSKINQNSLLSFNLLNFNEISSNDETQFSKRKVEKENSSIKEDSTIINSSITYFRCSKKENNERCPETINLEEEFLKQIKLISLNEDELGTLTISLELLSNVEQFKKYFKFFTNDNYFKNWIYPFENKEGIKNFFLPIWMSKNSLNLCQIIIGFLEQHILLNYEYFYYNNKIYELTNNDKIIKFNREINDVQSELTNKFSNINGKSNIKHEKQNIIINTNYNIDKINRNNINIINNDKKQKKEEKNEKLQRIPSKISISTLNDLISNFEEEEDSTSINSDKTNSNIDIYKKFSSNFSDNDKFFYSIYYNNKITNYNNFNDMIFTYYEQEIKEYCTIVNNNLKIFNKIKEKYQNEIECFIKKSLKDKYDISFGHYGSYYTGLQIEGSDMDIFILYNSKEDNNNILSFRNELYYLIRKNKPLFGAFKLPDDAIPPLVVLNIDIYDEIVKTTVNKFNYIKFEEKEKLKIDLTFNNNEEYLHINEKNVNYVKNAINEYPEIKPVILILKRYFKNINMNKVFRGGISSYSIFLLTLNAIKSYLKFNPNTRIGKSQLLFYVLKKFSSFDFCHYGIGSDNYDYKLNEDNLEENLYILDPITGKNIAYGKCKGDKLRKVFYNAYNILAKQINYFYNLGYIPYNGNPICSLNSLFQSRYILF